MRRLTVTIPEEYVAGLEDLAEDMGASISEAVREAVASYLMDNYWKDTIGGVARKAIIDGATNEDALALVRKRYPKAATSMASIVWYRSRLRKELGENKVQTDRQARATKE